MKFAKYLRAKAIPEWRKKYIAYKVLKKRLKDIHRVVEAELNEKGHRRSFVLRSGGSPVSFISMDEEANEEGERERPVSPVSIRTRGKMPEGYRSSKLRKPFLPIVTRRLHKPTQELPFEIMLMHVSPEERQFFNCMENEIEKINEFFNDKEDQAFEKLLMIIDQIRVVELHQARHKRRASNPADRTIASYSWLINTVINWFSSTNRALDLMGQKHQDSSATSQNSEDFVEQTINYRMAKSRIKHAMVEFYRGLEMLKNYRTLNQMGFAKILKKFDKIARWNASDYYMEKVNSQSFITSRVLEDIIKQVENVFVVYFAGGNRKKGMSRLRVDKLEKQHNLCTWRVGLYMGFALPILIQGVMKAIDARAGTTSSTQFILFEIYAAFLLPVIFLLLVAVNAYFWTKYRINYRFIFELDPRNYLDYQQLFELPALILALYACAFYLSFSDVLQPWIPPTVYPIIWFTIVAGILILPFPVLYHHARKWILNSFGRVIASFWYRVEFRDFFIADELNSLTYSIQRLPLFLCVYAIDFDNPGSNCNWDNAWQSIALGAVPAWWRFLQCLRRYRDTSESFPHLFNAAKYFFGMAANVLGGVYFVTGHFKIRPVWTSCRIIATLYGCAWDIRMDFGLLQPNSKHFLLRDEIVFPKWTYYAAILANILLRWSWLLGEWGFPWIDIQIFAFLVALGEVLRRFIWNFYRLENEHTNNCGQFRAIKEIPLPFKISTVPSSAEENALSTDTEAALFPSTQLTSPTLVSTDPQSGLPIAGSSAPPAKSPLLKKFYSFRDYENRISDRWLMEREFIDGGSNATTFQGRN
ncbi:uncharacterized protein VTP21DRAFT_8509 [Calcarisporiella thermophila]|uniref:uncharacterized protein n=1 Tax=Calcarisporiella thermophila TaxID=911321 RepID=UPI0037442A5C